MFKPEFTWIRAIPSTSPEATSWLRLARITEIFRTDQCSTQSGLIICGGWHPSQLISSRRSASVSCSAARVSLQYDAASASGWAD